MRGPRRAERGGARGARTHPAWRASVVTRGGAAATAAPPGLDLQRRPGRPREAGLGWRLRPRRLGRKLPGGSAGGGRRRRRVRHCRRGGRQGGGGAWRCGGGGRKVLLQLARLRRKHAPSARCRWGTPRGHRSARSGHAASPTQLCPRPPPGSLRGISLRRSHIRSRAPAVLRPGVRARTRTQVRACTRARVRGPGRRLLATMP